MGDTIAGSGESGGLKDRRATMGSPAKSVNVARRLVGVRRDAPR